jgi:exodeoxyribonuclease-3
VRILSWNVNGLRSVHNKGLFLEWLHEMSPDVLCLQETKAAEDQLPFDLRMVEGYEAHFAWPEHRRGYSGVALYTKEAPASVQRRLGVPELDMEGRMLVADYGAFVLLGVYFPNGRSKPERLDYKMRFYDAFLRYVDGLRAEGRHVVFCGDVNTAHHEIDLARPKENAKASGFLPEERAWIDQLLAHGYVDAFRAFHPEPEQYTFWDNITRARERNVGWRIDYFFVDEGMMPSVADSFIMADVTGSDHCPIGLDITLPS